MLLMIVLNFYFSFGFGFVFLPEILNISNNVVPRQVAIQPPFSIIAVSRLFFPPISLKRPSINEVSATVMITASIPPMANDRNSP